MKTTRVTLLAATLVLAQAPAMAGDDYSNYVELRVYPIQEEKRDRFLEFFEEHYLESQEVVGMRIWGQFRDLVTPTQFVWLRGYRNLEERADGLMKFYTSPVWGETGAEVRSMMAGRAQHVHFLEPASGEDGFADLKRPLLVSEEPQSDRPGVVVILAFLVEEESALAATVESVRTSIVPRFVQQGAVSLGLFVSSDEPNNFPLLPFIEDETIVAWFASFESREAYEKALPDALQPEPFETFVLQPGKRARLYHRMP